jgi:Carboxypeptidase regulatory-like domain/TonB dependent receptor
MIKQKVTAEYIALALLLFVLQAMWPSSMNAQVVGATLSGVVADSSGAAVPAAKISIRNVGTDDLREVSSNADGLYSAPNLLPGTYEVSVSAQGFSTVVQKGINLSVGAQQALNFTLKPGQVSQSVEVTDIIPAVQSNSSSISATVDSRTVRELPLNGRDWTSLATLEPGVAKVPNQVTTAFSANKGNRGFGNQLTDSGHRPNENSYRVNAIIVNDYSNAAPGGATGLNLGVDGVQEFSVVTTGYTAEYGRTSGAIINAITKSGTNQFHGDGYFFDRDKVFDAKNYFDPAGPIPSFRRIQFGGSAGGAIIKDKTFIFGDYEGVRQNQPASQAINVPSQEARNGFLCFPSTKNCTSLTTVAVNPNIVPYLALWPCPASCQSATNTDVVSLNVALAGIARENYFTGRLDQKVSANNTLAASYFFDSGPQTQPDPLQNAVHQVFSRRQMGSIEDTQIFSPQVVNTIRLGVNRVIGNINTPISGDAAATNSALAIAPGAKATPQISIGGFTTAIGLGGLNRFTHAWTSYQAADDAFITRGTHQIKVGFAFERMDYNILEQLSPNGRMNGYSLVNFLTNAPDKLNALAPGGSNEVAIRESLFAGYIQDDWRARSNLTVNLGLRYEATTKPNDANNRIQEITTLTNCSASPTACGPVHVSSFIAKNPTVKNFEPRIGFAYDPFKNGKTAIRGAFGMFDVLPLPYEFGLNTAATFPFQIVGADPNATLGTGAADPNVSFVPTKVRNRYIQQDPKRALVMNWNFNVQRELAPGWTALLGYVGSRSVHLSVAADDINLVQPITTSAGLLFPIGGTAIDPNWAGGTGGAGIRPVLFDGASSYESFQAQLKKAMTHGVQAQLSYALGQCKDTSSAPVTGDTYANSIAVPILFSQSYRHGPCDFDIRHVMSANLIWDVPGPKEGPMSYVLGGWELGTIVTVTSGSPFTPTIGAGGDPLGTGFNGDFSMDFANITKGCNPIHGGVNYLNVNCFALPHATADIASQCTPFGAPLTPITGTCANLLGNAGRNSLYGPGLATVDFSIFKNFRVTRISEDFNVQFRAEFFNILNHTNFAAPNFLTDGNNNSIFDANGNPLKNAGVLASTTTTSRQIQFGLKVVW